MGTGGQLAADFVKPTWSEGTVEQQLNYAAPLWIRGFAWPVWCVRPRALARFYGLKRHFRWQLLEGKNRTPLQPACFEGGASKRNPGSGQADSPDSASSGSHSFFSRARHLTSPRAAIRLSWQTRAIHVR